MSIVLVVRPGAVVLGFHGGGPRLRAAGFRRDGVPETALVEIPVGSAIVGVDGVAVDDKDGALQALQARLEAPSVRVTFRLPPAGASTPAPLSPEVLTKGPSMMTEVLLLSERVANDVGNGQRPSEAPGPESYVVFFSASGAGRVDGAADRWVRHTGLGRRRCDDRMRGVPAAPGRDPASRCAHQVAPGSPGATGRGL